MIYVDYIMLYSREKTVRIGESFFLQAAVSPENATCPCVKWSSTNPVVASVNPDTGFVYPNVEGTTTLIATACDGGGARAYFYLTVDNTVYASGISLNKTSLILMKGATYALTATVSPNNTTDKTVTWISTDADVATVSNGVISGVGGGTATIRAVANGGSNVVAECVVNVYEFSLSPNTRTLTIGASRRYMLAIAPAPSAMPHITWYTNDSDKITVSTDGWVTALREGSTTIYADIQAWNCSVAFGITCVDPREHVEVRKDAHSFYVSFESGKIWRNIGLDLSKRSEHYTALYPPAFNEENYDMLIPEEQRYLDNRGTTFSEQELGFLYFLDPMGIEYFVRTDACFDMSPEEKLFFKDRIYENIFGVKPRLFRPLLSGDLQYFEYPNYNIDFRYNVYSYAEMIFGSHFILDLLSIAEALSDILESVFSSLPYVSTVMTVVDLCRALFFSGSIVGLVEGAPGSFINLYTGDGTPENPGIDGASECGKMLGWCNTLLGVMSTITDIAEGLVPPNVQDPLIYQKINSENFATKFVVNGNAMTMSDIIDNIVTT